MPSYGSYRFTVSIDVMANSPLNAYDKLYTKMNEIATEEFEWQSEDEWFTPESDGELASKELLEQTITAYFQDDREERPSLPPISVDQQPNANPHGQWWNNEGKLVAALDNAGLALVERSQLVALWEAACNIRDNATDNGEAFVDEDREDKEDYPKDEDGNHWYHDWWQLHQACEAFRSNESSSNPRAYSLAMEVTKGLVRLYKHSEESGSYELNWEDIDLLHELAVQAVS